MSFIIYTSLVLWLLYGALIAFYRRGWMALPETKTAAIAENNFHTKVSVIIPARNETSNIAACVRSVLAQNYPEVLLEIIVVDDHSTDDTADIVQALALAYRNIRLIKLDETIANKAYKKRGIEMGIANATGSLIVTTDADCTHNKQWIAMLVKCHETTGAQFIAAPVSFITENKLLSVFQTLDFMTMQGITGASVYKRFHTMCNGANLAYTKAAFTAVNGFKGIDNIPTGDDMLLMFKIYKLDPNKVVYLKSANAIVDTPAAMSWKEFFNQRIRWASKATHYDDKRIFWTLLLVYIFNVWFLVLFIGAFFKWQLLVTLLAVLAAKTVTELWFIKPVATFFQKEKWIGWFAFLQPLHILYVVVSGWLGKFGKYEWKGRSITKS